MTRLLSSRAVIGEYYRVIEETMAASWVTSVVNTFRSDQRTETYPFLQDIPALSEWIGPRRMMTPTEDSVAITNKKYETGITFSNDELARDKTDQTLIRIADLGARVGQFPEKLISDLLVANGNAYDGIAYFGNHNRAKSPQINNAVQIAAATGTTPTVAEMVNAIQTAMQRIQGAVDSEGEPCNASGRRFLLMVPNELWPVAVAAINDQFVGGSVSNSLQSMLQRGYVIEAVPNVRVAAPFCYLFRTDARIRAGILQEERRSSSVLGVGSDYEAINDAQFFGITWQGGAALGRYELACRIEFT